MLICFCWTVYFLGGMVMENDRSRFLSLFLFSHGVMESKFMVKIWS